MNGYTPLQPMSPATFDQFGLLPGELRCKIWRYSFPRRQVNIREGIARSSRETYTTTFISRRWPISGEQLPVAAFVNQESRAETLRHYCRLYQYFDENSYWRQNHDLAIPRTIYFNPKLDTLFFTRAALGGNNEQLIDYVDKLFAAHGQCRLKCKSQVRKIEFYSSMQEMVWFNILIAAKLFTFPNLERIVLVRHSTTGREHDEHYLGYLKETLKDVKDNDPSIEREAPEVSIRVDDCVDGYEESKSPAKEQEEEKFLSLVGLKDALEE
ncbi:cyclin-like f-box protein [Rutstroemia sp. NJR-2017a WRK4]|nr:cyclin-like f-box protein [Rutstroemia sp. NJR-2017a WRK4]